MYVTDRNHVRSFEEYNFDAESLRPKSHSEHWVTDEVIVALGCDVSRKRALKALRHVVRKIEFRNGKGAPLQMSVPKSRTRIIRQDRYCSRVCLATDFSKRSSSYS